MSHRVGPRRSAWPFLALIPFGLGAWAPIYAGARLGRRSWIGWGVLWTLIAVAGWVVSIAQHGNGASGGLLLLLGWAGGAATSFTLSAGSGRRLDSPLEQAVQAGEQRLHDRQKALALARRDPSLAQEIGIGRPDRLGAVAAGVVDVNNASLTALLKLPGMTDELAARIIETRKRVGGFSSLEDMGLTLDLDGGLVEALRDETVFLPRVAP